MGNIAVALSIMERASSESAYVGADDNAFLQLQRRHNRSTTPTAQELVEFCGGSVESGRLPHEAGGVTGACLNWPNTQWRGWYYVRAFDPDPKIRGLSISFESKESWHEGEASQEFGSHSEVAYDGFEPEGTYLVPRGCHDARTQGEAIESCSWADEREQCGPNSRTTTYMWELPQCETPDQTTPCARVPPWGGPVMSLCWSWHTTSIQGGVLGRV